MRRCENCNYWAWTLNCWGDCTNPKVAQSPEEVTERSCVMITVIPRSKKVYFSTLDKFGCSLFENRNELGKS